jgi:hypothetical protein
MDMVVRRPEVLRGPPRPVFVARPGGGLRLLTELDPVDAATYRRLVARVAPDIEGALTPAVIANRVVGPTMLMEDWRVARRRWRRATARAEAGALRLRLDVADCYGSIRPEAVEAALEALGAGRATHLIRFLHELAERGVPGLPVGPDASAVLANAVLRRVDLAVTASGAHHVRWVDDLVIEVGSVRHATRVFDTVRRELAPIHLTLRASKTRLEDPRAPEHIDPSFCRAPVR